MSEIFNQIFRITLSISILGAICSLIPATATAQFETVADTFETVHDVPFSSGFISVLDNDTDLPADSLIVVITRNSDHGMLTFESDGTFTYLPDEGFVGEDSFGYVIRTYPIHELVFTPEASILDFQARVDAGSIGDASDTASIPIIGMASVDLGADDPPIEYVRIIDLDIRNQGPINLKFDFGSPFTIATLHVDAEAEAFQLGLNRAGSGGTASPPLGSFVQTGNKLGVDATVDLRGSGILGGAIPSGTEVLTTETDFDFGGSMIEHEGELVLILNIDSENQFDLGDNAIDLRISGTAVASGPRIVSQVSDTTTVVMNVISPTAIASSVAPLANALRSIYPNPVTTTATIEYNLARPGTVSVTVYDLLGREVAHLLSGSGTPGENRITWDTSNVPAGLYIVRVMIGERNHARTVVVR